MDGCPILLIRERRVEKVRKKLPIGIENFEEFFTEDFYYVDKTQQRRNRLGDYSGIGAAVHSHTAVHDKNNIQHHINGG